MGRWVVVDPARQFISGYVFNGNTAVNGYDEDGRLFIIDDILVGAAIGALVSGTTYSIFAGETWTWKNFGKAVGMGALSGGVGGGIAGMANAAGLQGTISNNLLYNMTTNAAGYSATTAMMGGDITAGGLIGAMVGGAIGGSLPGFSGVEGGALKNIGSELIEGMARGALMGSMGGGVGSLIDGGDFGAGFKSGFISGAKAGFTTSFMTITAFGHAIQPDPIENKEAIKAIKAMEADFSLVGDGAGDFKPVYRSGGVYGLFTSRGVAHGRNLVIPENEERKRTNYTFIHETAHYYQQNSYGLGAFYRNGIIDQWRHSILGKNIYGLPGNQEWAADQLWKIYRP